MHNPRDLYTWFQVVPLVPGGGDKPSAEQRRGSLLIEYSVRRFVDVRNLSVRHGYHVTCTQRIIVANDATEDFGAHTVEHYDYPVMVVSGIRPYGLQEIYLVDYTPKTLNSAVTSNRTDSVGNNTQTSSQHTTGSSTSTTNSYETSASVGTFGDLPTLGVSRGHGESTTTETSTSDTTGHTSGSDTVRALSDTMSIKDWGSYASVDAALHSVKWFWGQQHPWDVFTYHNAGADGGIVLPPEIHELLYDRNENQVYPPSQLSTFGINFVSRASWVCQQPVGQPEGKLAFSHTVVMLTGHHGLTAPETFRVQLTLDDVSEWTSPDLDLAQLALDPVPIIGHPDQATVGFVRSQFTFFAPASADASADQFSIRAPTNTLLVTGRGFHEPADNDTALSATLTGASTATLTLFFKIASELDDLTLYLKQWKTTDNGCTLTVTINEHLPITRHIDSRDTGSGTDNIYRIMLRNTDYASPEFYDYLVMGLNRITVTIAAGPPDTHVSSGYAVRAVAIV